MADDFYKQDFIFLQLVKNKDVTHFKFVVKLIIIKFAMVADLKYTPCVLLGPE